MGGSKKKTTYMVDMDTQRILPDNSLYESRVINAAKTLKDSSYTLRNSLIDQLNAGSSVFTNYYNFSKWYSPDRLPECYISGLLIPKDNINNYLLSKHSITKDRLLVLSYDYNTPFSYQWVQYYLANNYGFNTSYSIIIKDDKYYILDSYIPTDKDTIKCYFKGITSVLEITNSVVNINIVSKDETHDYKNIMKQKEELYYDAVTNHMLYNRVTVVEYLQETVDKGTASSGITITEVSRRIIDVPDSTDITLEIPNVPKNKAYVVDYTVDNVPYIFIYFPELGKYDPIGQVYIPTIGMPNTSPTTLVDAMPVTVVRDNYFNINDYDKESPRYIPAGDSQLVAHRSPKLTKERFKEIDKILNSLNLSVEDVLKGFNENPDEQYLSDAFLMMGVVPLDRHNIVSKCLYETIIYFDSLIGIDDKRKEVYFSEEPYNVSYSWTSYRRVVENKIIGKVDTYSHEFQKLVPDTKPSSELPILPDLSTSKIGKIYTDHVTAISLSLPTYNLEIDEWSWYIYEEYEEKYYYITSSSISSDGEVIYTDEKHIIYKKVFTSRITNAYEPSEIRVNISIEDGDVDNLILRKQITPTKCDTIYLNGFSGSTVIGREYTDNVSNGITSDNFIIPLFTKVVDKFTPQEKIELLERSLRFVLYVAKLHVQKLKWYQTGIFKAFLQIIAIVITVVVSWLTAGTGTTPTMAAFASTLFFNFVVGTAIQFALNIIAITVKNKTLKAVFMTATVVAGAMFTGNININNILKSVILTGIDLLNAAIMFIENITVTAMKALQSKIEKFEKLYKNKLTEFEEKLEQFNKGITVEDLLDINKSIDSTTDEVYIVNYETYYSSTYDVYSDYDLLYTDNYDLSISNSYNNLLTFNI